MNNSEREYMESEEFEVQYLPRGTMLEIDIQEDALPPEVDRSHFLVHGRESPEGRVYDRLRLHFFYFTGRFVDENGVHEGGQSVFEDEILRTKSYINNSHPIFSQGLPVRVNGGMSLVNTPIKLKDDKPQNAMLRINIPEHLTMIPLEE